MECNTEIQVPSISCSCSRETPMPLSTSPNKRRWRFVHRRLPRDSTVEAVAESQLTFDHLNLPADARRRHEAEAGREFRITEVQRELKLTIDSIPALVAAYQPDGTRGFVNRRWLDYTGLVLNEAKEVERQRGTILVHPDQAEAAERAWRAAVATGRALLTEWRLRGADGAYRWHSVHRVPLHDAAGNVIRWYGTAFDIEEQKVAESALQRSEAYLAEAQKLSHTGSLGWNVSSGEIFWSEETFRIFGYEPGTNVTIELVLNRVHPDDLARVELAVNRATTHKCQTAPNC